MLIKSTILTVTVMILFASSVKPQAHKVFSDLHLDVTTSEEIVSLFGRPAQSKVKHQEVQNSTVRLKFAILSYKDLGGWDKVEFLFHENKLFQIEYHPKRNSILAAELPDILKTDFVTVDGFSSKVDISVFKGQKDPSVPRVYETIYYMVSVTPERSIIAHILNSSFKAIFKESFKKPTIENYPGKLAKLMVTSRRKLI